MGASRALTGSATGTKMNSLQNTATRYESPEQTWQLAELHALPCPEFALQDALEYFLWHDNLTAENLEAGYAFARKYDIWEQEPDAMYECLTKARAGVAASKAVEQFKDSEREAAEAVMVRHSLPETHLDPKQPDALICEFKSETTLTFEVDTLTGKRQPVYEVVTETPMQIAYTGLQSKTPKMKGNFGEGSLDVVKRTRDEIELVEQTAIGNLVMHSVFLTEKAAVITKQYRLGTAPYSMLQGGRCW